MDQSELVEIDGDDELYRRVPPHGLHPDGTVNSAAFKVRNEYDNSMSVDLAHLTTPEKVLEGKSKFRLGVFVAKDPRTLGFDVHHDPLPDNYAHSLIQGENNREKSLRLAEMIRLLP